jgi:hypothetical protein
MVGEKMLHVDTFATHQWHCLPGLYRLYGALLALRCGQCEAAACSLRVADTNPTLNFFLVTPCPPPPHTHTRTHAGKIIVSPGGTCTKPDGSTDVYLVCVSTHPICYKPAPNQPGKCSTYAESQAGSPPSSGACTEFAQLGQYCNVPNGQCCGGAPKNAKCESNKCVTTYPTPAPAPAPVPGPTPMPCTSFVNLGENCNLAQGKCCGGGPKNAKCENDKCVTTYPTPGAPGPVGVTPAGRR